MHRRAARLDKDIYSRFEKVAHAAKRLADNSFEPVALMCFAVAARTGNSHACFTLGISFCVDNDQLPVKTAHAAFHPQIVATGSQACVFRELIVHFILD